MCVYEDFLWVLTLTGVRSSSRAAQRWPDTHPGRGEEEDSEWRDEAASGGEDSVFVASLQSGGWRRLVENPFVFYLFNSELSTRISWPGSDTRSSWGNRWGPRVRAQMKTLWSETPKHLTDQISHLTANPEWGKPSQTGGIRAETGSHEER